MLNQKHCLKLVLHITNRIRSDLPLADPASETSLLPVSNMFRLFTRSLHSRSLSPNCPTWCSSPPVAVSIGTTEIRRRQAALLLAADVVLAAATVTQERISLGADLRTLLKVASLKRLVRWYRRAVKSLRDVGEVDLWERLELIAAPLWEGAG